MSSSDTFKQWLQLTFPNTKCPLFNNLKQIAEVIKEQGSKFIDNHGPYERSFDRVNVVYHTEKGLWCFRGGATGVQCKNPFYVSSGKLHLTEWSEGITLESSDQQRLLQGEVIRQSEYEQTLSLPVDEFVDIVLADK